VGGLAAAWGSLQVAAADVEKNPEPAAGGEGPNHRVIVARARKPDREAVRSMLERSVTALSGEESPADAWGKLLGIAGEETVGIKINVLGGKSLMSSPVLVDCIVEGLRSIGVADERIVIWERTDKELVNTGWELRREGTGVRCYGTLPDSGYDPQPSLLAAKEIHFSRILTQEIDLLINVPVLKDHGVASEPETA